MPGDPEIDGLLDGQQDAAGVSIVSLADTLTFYEVGAAPSGAAGAGGDALGSPVAEKQRSQQIIQGLASLFFIGLFIVPGLFDLYNLVLLVPGVFILLRPRSESMIPGTIAIART